MTSDASTFQTIEVRSWSRFHSPRLVVSPDVVGRRHCFTYDSAEVEIQLPSAERIEEAGRDIVGTITTRWAATNKPARFNIEKVDVTICLGQKIVLPSKVLDVQANAFDIIPADKHATLDEMAERHGDFAILAFEYWLSLVRLVADDHRVGRRAHQSELRDWDVRLHDVQSGKKIWIEPSVAHYPTASVIELDHWLRVEASLKTQATVPTHKSLEFAARHDRDRGDFRRALMDTAVSCETYLRSSVLSSLPLNLAVSARDQIDKANISQYINHLFPEILDSEDASQYRKELKSKLNSLFELRNDLFHRGASNKISLETCEKFLILARRLFALKMRNAEGHKEQ